MIKPSIWSAHCFKNHIRLLLGSLHNGASAFSESATYKQQQMKRDESAGFGGPTFPGEKAPFPETADMEFSLARLSGMRANKSWWGLFFCNGHSPLSLVFDPRYAVQTDYVQTWKNKRKCCEYSSVLWLGMQSFIVFNNFTSIFIRKFHLRDKSDLK